MARPDRERFTESQGLGAGFVLVTPSAWFCEPVLCGDSCSGVATLQSALGTM